MTIRMEGFSFIKFLIIKRKSQFDTYNLLVYGSIIFACIGDFVLLFEELFLHGLISFLLGHLCYIGTFIFETKEKEVRKRLTLRQEILITIPYLISFAILGFLYPHLGQRAFPVFVYTTIIIIMARLTWLRYSKTTSMSFKMVMIGAILFVISDFSIAIDRFVYKAKINYLIIGVSYLAAQYLIIHGIIEGNKKGKTKRD